MLGERVGGTEDNIIYCLEHELSVLKHSKENNPKSKLRLMD